MRRSRVTTSLLVGLLSVTSLATVAAAQQSTKSPEAPSTLRAEIVSVFGDADSTRGTRFGSTSDVLRAPDGAYFVLDMASRQLRAFDSTGTLRWRTAGARGRGDAAVHGVFIGGNIPLLALSGDTLAVLDNGGPVGRVHLFNRSTGAALKGPSGRAIIVLSGFTMYDPNVFDFERTRAGWTVLLHHEHEPGNTFGRQQRLAREVYETRVIDLETGTLGAALWSTSAPARPRYLVEGTRESFAPFTGQPSVSLAPGGLYYAHPDSMWIKRVRPGEVDSIVLDIRPTAITERTMDSVYTRARRNGEATERALRAVPLPAQRRVVGRIHVAPDGSMAFSRPDITERLPEPSDSVYVTFLDAQGATRGTIAFPPEFELDGFDGEHVVGMQPDRSRIQGRLKESDGVIYVKQIVRYSIPALRRAM